MDRDVPFEVCVGYLTNLFEEDASINDYNILNCIENLALSCF